MLTELLVIPTLSTKPQACPGPGQPYQWVLVMVSLIGMDLLNLDSWIPRNAVVTGAN